MNIFNLTLLAILVVSAFADTGFLKNAKRAEYFSKTDYEVPTWDFTIPDDEFNQLKNLVNAATGFGQTEQDFKTKNGSLVFTLNGESKTFPEVTFSLGGVSSRYYPKQAFNVKIRNDKLFGRKQFRIRSDAREATFLRSKLFCDITNRLGMPSAISANYIKLSINGEDMGFYVIMDSLKMTYVNIEYGDKDSTNLIQCGSLNSDLTLKSLNSKTCTSENDDNPDMSSFRELLTTLDNAQTVSQMEEILDVEVFMKSVLMDYLTGSWDHFCLFGHNYSMYKPPNGKWIMVLYDYDATFGQDLSMGLMFNVPSGIQSNNVDTWPKARFEDWHGGKHVIDVILKDRPQLFLSTLQTMITEAFNPKVLFPRIDELKEFIRPYVEADKKANESGKLPGRIKTSSTCYDYTISQFEANSEFTHINTNFNGMTSKGYALKRWILDKFNFVCTQYKLDCSVASEYLNDQYHYTTTTVVEPTNVNPGGFPGWGGGGWGGNWGGNWWPTFTTTTTTRRTTTTKKTTTTTKKTTTTTTKNTPQPTDSNCWSIPLGYKCCTSNEVVFTDSDGDWGVENNEWCGIPKKQTCWSDALGFPCCNGCIGTVYTDSDGNWGVENNEWCGLPKNC